MSKRTKAITFLMAQVLLLPMLFSATFDFLGMVKGDSSAAAAGIWGDPHVGIVADTTASMGPELNAIAAAWQAQSQKRPLSGTYHLTGFKDEALYLGNTNDPVTFYSWLNTLEAGGGGECPDNTLAGLSNIAGNLPKTLTPPSEVMLFTDAAPLGKRTAVAHTANRLIKRGVQVYTLSNGWCHDAILNENAMAFLTMVSGGEFSLTDGPNYFTDTLIILNKVAATDQLGIFQGVVTPEKPAEFGFDIDSTISTLGVGDDDYYD